MNQATFCAFQERRKGKAMLRAANLIPTAANLVACGAALLTLCCSTAAEARHHRHYSRHDDPSLLEILHYSRGTDPRFSATRPGIPIGTMLDQLERDCSQRIVDLRNFRPDVIERTIGSDDAQDAMLENIGRIANETADMLAANCQNAVADEAAARLDSADRSVDVLEAVLRVLQGPVQTFYESLRDEQKAVLVARSIIASGDTSLAADTSRTKARRQADADPEKTEVPQAPNCGQWGAEFRAWPIVQIEQMIPVWPRQRAAFYELAAAIQRAADALADACPSGVAQTPIDRIAQTKRKLDAVRQAVAIIRPALVGFDEMLDGGQRQRFHDAM
jgi:hypothetical protein